jgi:hypothetical protein
MPIKPNTSVLQAFVFMYFLLDKIYGVRGTGRTGGIEKAAV